MKTRLVDDGDSGKLLMFWCPGCSEPHGPRVEGARVQSHGPWTWNGDRDRPTLSPSIKVESANREGPTVCHSFVQDGQIQFLGDCTHALAGKTVPIPDWPYEDR